MKALHTLFQGVIVFFIWTTSNAQTLTCAYNCPKIGQVFSVMTVSPVLHTEGMNQLWDFTKLSVMGGGSFQISYVDPTTISSFSLFPQATIARTDGYNTDFLQTDNSGVKLTQNTKVTYNDQPIELPLPFAFGSTHSETIITSYVSGGDSIELITASVLKGVGTGTLMLPSGTYKNVLRISGQIIETHLKNGTVENVVTDNVNYYYSDRISHPLLLAHWKSETGLFDYIPYTAVVTALPVYLTEDLPGSPLQLSPNPASSKLHISGINSYNSKLIAINSIGKIVAEFWLAGGNSELDIHDLPDGLYTVQLLEGGKIKNQRLVVSH